MQLRYNALCPNRLWNGQIAKADCADAKGCHGRDLLHRLCMYITRCLAPAAYRELSDWRSSSITGDRSNCVHNSFRSIDTGCSVGDCAIGSVKLELCMYYEPDRRPSEFQLQHTRCNVCQTRYGLNAMLVNHLVMTNRRICLYKYPRDLFGN